ncbi:hypothetical protein HGRIS_009364 [Hohenbuehelia grisea]|uniref:Protein CPL1-like domain-containing protein n=1 Tax=Hohenbuehelia grisea TaxID=104357 RepID=A0ABR3J146_9AGAR
MLSLTIALALFAFFVRTALGAADPQPAGIPTTLLDKRASSDTCANLRVRDGQLGTLYGCFCDSAVDRYVDRRYLTRNRQTRASLKDRLAGIIGTNGQVCNYPDNAVPSCRNGNACFFTCTNGFTANQATRECECPGPNRLVCNGRCRVGRACTSGILSKRETHQCPVGHSVCGVRSSRGRSSTGWECLDTQNTLESCGGCMYAFGNNNSLGRDCSAIQGVNTVSCFEGQCNVQSCRAGYIVSADGTDCEPIMGLRQQEPPSFNF